MLSVCSAVPSVLLQLLQSIMVVIITHAGHTNSVEWPSRPRPEHLTVERDSVCMCVCVCVCVCELVLSALHVAKELRAVSPVLW